MMPLPPPPRPTCPVAPLPDMDPSPVIWSVQLQLGMQPPVLTPFHVPLAAKGPDALDTPPLGFLAGRALVLSSCPEEMDLLGWPIVPPSLPP